MTEQGPGAVDGPHRRYLRRDQLDAYEKPPEEIRNAYKIFQKLDKAMLDTHPQLIDAALNNTSLRPAVSSDGDVRLPDELQQILENFLFDSKCASNQRSTFSFPDPKALHVPSIPGLSIYPSLLPPEVQLHLLHKLLHRDLSNASHNTNLHLHYQIPYASIHDGVDASSFFDANASNVLFEPKDASVHKPITMRQFLNKKLRWMTLGGQYDWTKKLYPPEQPPSFPPDLKKLLEDLFPMKAEAAIVNLYSPGDTLSLHRDVSEESRQPLVSISLGCEAIFIIGLDGTDERDEPRIATLRLRSGDAVLMSGDSRYAWHGVPRVIEGTCPVWMQDWPYEDSLETSGKICRRYEEWRGWMQGKRINLNVRQMFDDAQEGDSGT